MKGLRSQKLFVRLLLCMEKEQCLKVLPAIGFCTSKMGILIWRMNPTVINYIQLDQQWLNQLLREKLCQMASKLVDQMDYDKKKTVVNPLPSMGKFQKLSTWVPHNKKCKQQKLILQNHCQFIHSTLLNTWSQTAFSSTALSVTGDEKWYIYVNMKQQNKEWVNPNKQAALRAKQGPLLRQFNWRNQKRRWNKLNELNSTSFI